MGLNTRPATCTSCGKRLNRKHWYYRNGAYFCKPRCWETEKDKRQQATAASGTSAKTEAAGEAPSPAKTQPAPAKAAESAGESS